MYSTPHWSDYTWSLVWAPCFKRGLGKLDRSTVPQQVNGSVNTRVKGVAHMGCLEPGVLGRWSLPAGELSDEGRLPTPERKYWSSKAAILGARVGIGTPRKDFYKTTSTDAPF